MAVTFIRTLIIFIVLLIVIRLMGKRQIGEMQPFEFIITLIIADLACIPMADVSIPLFYGIGAIIGVFILHQILSLLERLGPKVNKVMSGKPSIVIDKDGVNILELKKNNMDVNDLAESMRVQGYFSFDDVYYAIFESNGKLSALENSSKSVPTNQISFLIVNCGKIDEKNLNKLNLSRNEIHGFLQKNKIELKDVEVMTVDNNGRTYLKQKNNPYKILYVKENND